MLFKDWNQLWVTSSQRVHPFAIKLLNLARAVMISTSITHKIGMCLSVKYISGFWALKMITLLVEDDDGGVDDNDDNALKSSHNRYRFSRG